MSDWPKTVTISAGTVAFIFIITIVVVFTYQNWYRLGSGYAWDTLKIRCEEERGGILIGENCFKKDALFWSEENAPR